jgi:hypothetical protein
MTYSGTKKFLAYLLFNPDNQQKDLHVRALKRIKESVELAEVRDIF